MGIAADDSVYMAEALALAEEAQALGEVPVGAVLVHQGVVIGRGFNRPIGQQDPSAHAEIVAMREGGKTLQNYRLLDSTLYVTLEPCAMCTGAIIHARVKRLVYAATDPKRGACGSAVDLLHADFNNHQVAVSSGVLAESASVLLQAFFRARR